MHLVVNTKFKHLAKLLFHTASLVNSGTDLPSVSLMGSAEFCLLF